MELDPVDTSLLSQNLFEYFTEQSNAMYKVTIKPKSREIKVQPWAIDEKKENWEEVLRESHLAYGSGEIISFERLPSLKSIYEAGHEYVAVFIYSAAILLEESQRPSEKKK